MGRAEVGAIAGEDVDPLLTRIVEGFGHKVRDIAFTAAGHADVRRCSAGVVPDEHVGGGDR